ncbi:MULTISPECIES: hypothetical protein [Muribaculaceae]|jgi:hypothetical protein|uniref:hypothetical protein n=1 Tax=Muribaculaceae TaxID=2005473 RepID=UPI002578DDA7|nr:MULTISPECIES: hypothetical protein [Muribaculaceae]
MAKGYKTGGRKKGTPNKNNPTKGILMNHSADYFTPRPQVDLKGNPRVIQIIKWDNSGDGPRRIVEDIEAVDMEGKPLVMSDFEFDMKFLAAADRVAAELKILEFHTPRMKSQDINMEVNVGPRTIEDTLKALCGGEDDDEDE